MVVHSKVLPPELARLPCSKILHPWTTSCFQAYLDMLKSAIIGSGGFFVIMYFFQYLIKAIKKTNQKPDQDFLKETLITYLRSSFLFSSMVGSLFIAFSCLFRNSFGKFYKYTLVFLPAMLAGFAGSLESHKNKDMFVTTWANLTFEVWIRQLEDSKILRWSLYQKTLVFMILTSSLSYMFHKDLPDQRYFWYFVPKPPPKVIQDGQQVCTHQESCQYYIFNHFIKYFGTGFALQYLKILFSSITKPKLILSSLINFKTYKLGALLGFYVGIYQSVRCYLYRRQKGFSIEHDAIAGFLAGSAFCFQPSINVFNSVFITIMQILTRISCRKKILPNIPYRDFIFAYCTGLLFHTRLFYPHQCPKLMIYLMSATTHQRCDMIASHYYKILKEYLRFI